MSNKKQALADLKKFHAQYQGLWSAIQELAEVGSIEELRAEQENKLAQAKSSYDDFVKKAKQEAQDLVNATAGAKADAETKQHAAEAQIKEMTGRALAVHAKALKDAERVAADARDRADAMITKAKLQEADTQKRLQDAQAQLTSLRSQIETANKKLAGVKEALESYGKRVSELVQD